MNPCFRTQRRVEWRDTDAAGIAHFSAFLVYMEQVEHEFLRGRGLSVHSQVAGEPVSWPRVAVRCDYSGSVRFEDVLEIELSVARLGKTSVTYEFQFTQAGRLVAVGSTTAVCCKLNSGQAPQPLAIPDDFRRSLAASSTEPAG